MNDARGKGILFVLSGPSGVGKGTVCKELLQRMKDLVYSVSATTRAARSGELEGVNYFFLERTDFEDKIREHEFLEYADVYGNYYGTPRSFVENKINNGCHVILEIDIQGAKQVKINKSDAVFIFLNPPNLQELENRISARGSETEESMAIRLASAVHEMEVGRTYDFVVVNETVGAAVDKILCIIEAEECRASRYYNQTGKGE